MNSRSDRATPADTLDRGAEVDTIAALLVREARKRPDHSFVLALDAEYGVGKSFFLDLLAHKLGEDHPVARIDAWADDSGNEPSVAIMASIEDALQEFLDKPKVAEKLKVARRNIVPIIVKGAGGVFTKGLARYVDETSLEAIHDLLDETGKDPSDFATAISEGSAAGVEAVGALLTDLAEKRAQKMIDDYRQRRKSREIFKQSMRELLGSLHAKEAGKRGPLIVIVDELDRCRPDYSIKLLEEIKHFFDIGDVCFVLAIYEEQLAHSVESVYGSNFRSKEYLRRFFNYRYELPLKNYRTFVADQLEFFDVQCERLRSPPKDEAFENLEGDASEYIALIFEAMKVHAREGKAAIRLLRQFLDAWALPLPVELTVLIPHIINYNRGKPWVAREDFQAIRLAKYRSFLPYHANNDPITIAELFTQLSEFSNRSLIHTVNNFPESPGAPYIYAVLRQELRYVQEQNRSSAAYDVPPSYISTYRRRLALLD
jgi:hypothetical protein